MTNDDLRAALSDGFFRDELSDECLDQLAAVSRLVDFPADRYVFRAGEPASCIYIILDGMVAIEIESPCRRIRLLTLGPGELVGWSPLLQLQELTASAWTMSPMRAIEFDAAQLLWVFERDKRLGYEFLFAVIEAMAKRLNAEILQLYEVCDGSQLLSSE